MPSTKDIRRRIRSVKSIEKITNAMKMVAAARLRKAQDRALAARPYSEKMHMVMENLTSGAGQIEHPLLEVRDVKNIAFVVVGAERGLAGSYNVSIMNRAMAEIRKQDPDCVKLVLVGKKAVAYFRRLPYEVLYSLDSTGNDINFSTIYALTTHIRSMFEAAQVDAVYLVYAKFVTAMTQVASVITLLPMSTPTTGEVEQTDFIFEPNAAMLLADLLPRYLETQIYQALVEAQASEQGARMTAMAAATKNAGEMIQNLTLVYNKARQAAITKEITEIVGGAEALK